MTTLTTRTPVLFIHGLWLHASSWAPWLTLFQEAGYAPVAPGWPGEADSVDAARAMPDAVADLPISCCTPLPRSTPTTNRAGRCC
jgi:non-heme chloroperoxidase